MAAFPPPNLAAALADPVVSTTDANGFVYDTTSQVWKEACAVLPSCAAVQWPGYATTCIEDTINGVPVVIQPWMGLCEQFFGKALFPGGVGGEVAVYVKVPGGRPLPNGADLPGPLAALADILNTVALGDLWWPDADMQPEIDFTLFNPTTGDVLLRADPQSNYWVNKWMEPPSYDRYKQSHPVPQDPTQYRMTFTVNGVTRTWIPNPVV